MSQVIFWQGLYAYEYIRIFEQVIPQCKGFLDIGANTGIYSVIAAAVNPRIQVLAFDPTDAAQFYLSKNIRANGFENRIYNYAFAVSDKEAQLQFYNVKNPKYPFLKYNLGGASSLVYKPEFYESVKVQSVQADSFIELHHPGMQIDFIKIDAEGAEPEILNGLARLIEKNNPIVVCEVRFNDVTAPLFAFFSKRNYGFYLFENNSLRKTTDLQNSKSASTDCFFVPQDKTSWIQSFIS